MIRFLDRFTDDVFRPVVYQDLDRRLVALRVALTGFKYASFACLMAFVTAFYLSLPTYETQVTTTDISGGGWTCRGRGMASGAFQATVPLQRAADCTRPFDIASVDATGKPTGCFECTITYAFPWRDEADCRRRLDLSTVPGTGEESSIPFTTSLSLGPDPQFRIFLVLPDFPWLSASCRIPIVVPGSVRKAMAADAARGTSYHVALQEFVTGECFDPRGGPSLCDRPGEDYTGRYRLFLLGAWDDVRGDWVFREKVMQAPAAISPAFLREIDPALAATRPLDFGGVCAGIPPPPPYECARTSRKGLLEATSIAFGGTGLLYGALSYLLGAGFARVVDRSEDRV
jgi:hypothetical protein